MRGREKITAREWKVSLKRDRMGNCEREEDLEEGGDRNRERIQERDGARISEENDSGSQRGDEIRNRKLKTHRGQKREGEDERNLERTEVVRK